MEDNKQFSTPKVTIDLEEYMSLKLIKENEEKNKITDKELSCIIYGVAILLNSNVVSSPTERKNNFKDLQKTLKISVDLRTAEGPTNFIRLKKYE